MSYRGKTIITTRYEFSTDVRVTASGGGGQRRTGRQDVAPAGKGARVFRPVARGNARAAKRTVLRSRIVRGVPEFARETFSGIFLRVFFARPQYNIAVEDRVCEMWTFCPSPSFTRTQYTNSNRIVSKALETPPRNIHYTFGRRSARLATAIVLYTRGFPGILLGFCTPISNNPRRTCIVTSSNY